MTNNKISTQIHREKRSDILLKRKFTKKVSSLLASLMLLSIFLPVLAFAQSFEKIEYKADGTITGTVYLDTYVPGAVYLKAFGPNNGFEEFRSDSVGEQVYHPNKGYRYTFTYSVKDATYTSVRLAVYDTDGTPYPVSDAVYNRQLPNNNNGGSGGGIPGGTGIIDSNGKADATQLAALLKANTDASLEIPGDFVLLPLSALAEGNTLTVKNANGSYTLPLTLINKDALAVKLGVAATADILIRVSIAKVDEATQASIVAATYGKSTVLTSGIDFKVLAEATGVPAVEVTFGNTYTKRTINIDKAFTEINSAKSTGVLFANGAVTFVPSTFASEGAKTVVTIHRIGNSIYTAIASDITFTDISNHWGKAFIERLVNKQVLAGYVDGTFKPRQAVTRAEFVSILVNALGVKTVGATTYGFKDVAAGKWYTDAVNSAAHLKLIAGAGNNTFNPDATITREEAASVVVNALKFVQKPVTVTDAEIASFLAPYNDKAKVSTWAKENVAIAVKAGIVLGVSPTALNSDATASRAEAVTMLTHLLEGIDFID